MRSCFLPDLSGLHVRIYQFRELLRQDMPALSAHLDDLQVDPAYVSQWFLSFFAVTCPLPMLFRIYDVIFCRRSVGDHHAGGPVAYAKEPGTYSSLH